MAARTPRAALALVGALVALGPVAASVPASPPATAPAAGACSDSTGITVVVDLTRFGGGVQVRCAPQPVRSGYEALTRAGFEVEGTRQFPGLLCRIDGKPTPEQDPCVHAPPGNAYWAYWHAPRGGSWTYSSSGAGSRVPPPGSVEGWAFGDDARPGVDPPAPPPTTTTTRSPVTTRPSTGGTGGGPAGDTIGEPTATPGPTGPSTTATTAAAAAEPTTTTTDDTPAGGTTEEDTDAEQASGAASSSGGDRSGGGSPVGAIVGLTAAAALTAAGVRAARRRRAVEEELA